MSQTDDFGGQPPNRPSRRRLRLPGYGRRLSPESDGLITMSDGSTPTLDPVFYRLYYRDLEQLSDDEAAEHYRLTGLVEQRLPNADVLIELEERRTGILPPDFNEELYLRYNRDIAEIWRFPRAGAFHFLRFGRAEGRNHRPQVFDQHHLHLVTNRIYDLPEIVVDPDEPARINVLVPAFDFGTMSAGFFGVFQVARFVASQGFRVRLVMFDNFYWNEHEFRLKLQDFPGMEDLFDELEVEYIGERLEPLIVSPQDNCIATVWYSAYLARKIMDLGSKRPFLYLIQDYETNFYAGGSLRTFAEASYDFSYHALFSTQALQQTFLSDGIGAFREPTLSHEFFNNAAASTLPDKETFLAPRKDAKHKLAFYSRHAVNRNMFELGALAMGQALQSGTFGEGNWQFYGVGIGESAIELAPGTEIEQLPRMNLKDYSDMIASFDIGLSLMASPHPSLLPFDLGGSGAVVVTNSYGVKTQEYFDGLCGNVIACEPTVDDIVQGLRRAVERVTDLEARYAAAESMAYPRSWAQTWTPRHESFIKDVFMATPQWGHQHDAERSIPADTAGAGRSVPDRQVRHPPL